MEYLDSVNDKRKDLQEQRQKEFLHKQSLSQSKENTKKIVDAIESEAKSVRKVKLAAESDLASKDDIDAVIKQLKENQLAQLMGNSRTGKPSVVLANGTDVEDIMAPLASKIDEALKTLANNNKDEKVAKALDKSFKDFAKAMSLYMVRGVDESRKTSQDIQDAISSLDLRPVVNVPAPKVNVQANPEVDLSPLESKLDDLRTAIQAIPTPNLDTTDLMIATDAVRNAIENMRFPVPNYVLPFKDIDGAATQVQLDANGNLPITVETDQTDPQVDVFNQLVTGIRNNQLEIDFSNVDPDTITQLTITKTNGGDASTSGGQAVFETSTNTSGEINAVTTRTTIYHPHAENYAAFTAIFTTGIANSFQRIGLYSDTNGFFLGYEGTSFGVTKRSGGVDVTTPQASFNIDTLTGQSGSKYTRNGVPEALDTTKDNLYRIRYGWLGAAPIYWEVLSPDGEWVLFHIIRHPNTAAVPTIEEPNQPLRLHIKKTTAGATNLTVKTACWAAGTTSDLQKITSTLYDETLAKTVRSVITGVTTGGGGGYVNVKVNPSGALTVESEPKNTSTTAITTASVTNSNTTVLAANADRLGATIYNEGSVTALVKLGATASASSYTVKLITDAYYEVPFGYTGIITGITASGTATLRVTELEE